MSDPPVVRSIDRSRTLGSTRLYAEAWDAAGLYQVGSFPGSRFAEWNGLYRDAVRRFVAGEPGMLGEMAARLCGSSDLYQATDRLPTNSVNHVTCHDGFTLNDLVSYEHRHNEANGEGGRDGHGHNFGTNSGVEGETDDPAILAARGTRARSFLATLMVSQGVPMILMGDEVLRTQHGNNNAYCQDNEIGWFDWTRRSTHADMLRFTREIIALRRRHPSLRQGRFLTGKPRPGESLPDIAWHGARLGDPRWEDVNARVLAFTLAGVTGNETPLHVILNMGGEAIEAEVPAIDGRTWHRAVDTGRPSPDDVRPPDEQEPIVGESCRVGAGCVVVLEAR